MPEDSPIPIAKSTLKNDQRKLKKAKHSSSGSDDMDGGMESHQSMLLRVVSEVNKRKKAGLKVERGKAKSTLKNYQRKLKKVMGIVKDIIVHGKGSPITSGQIVTVHCAGYVEKNGLYEKFWSTMDGQRLRYPSPFSFKVGKGHVIKVWDEGVLGMKLGEVAILKCTYDDAFGAGGYPAWNVGPNSNLEFDIEVVAIDWQRGKEDIGMTMKEAVKLIRMNYQHPWK